MSEGTPIYHVTTDDIETIGLAGTILVRYDAGTGDDPSAISNALDLSNIEVVVRQVVRTP